MTDILYEALNPLLGPLRLPRQYVPYEPTVKQEFFLLCDQLQVFFGGAAGPGKSWGLLMGALQYVDVPGYHALLLRPSLTEFEQEGGLIPVSHDWLGGTDASWNGSLRQWTFPSQATLRFGYLGNRADLSHYKGGGVSFLGFDELTSFPEFLYRGMFRLLRQATGALPNVPLRARSASNPGDIGHQWVKDYFIDPLTRHPDVVYVPAKMRDNPHLDIDAYLLSLAHMHPVDRQRLIDGDWDVSEEGTAFNRHAFTIVPAEALAPFTKRVRYWDLAATEPSPMNPDPDYTVGLFLGVDKQGLFTIIDIERGRWNADGVEARVRENAERDGKGVDVYIEQEPGASGKSLVSHYKRQVLAGYACHAGLTRSAAKEVRARPVSAATGNGLVRIVQGCRNAREFVDEVVMFPNPAVHDDCVDALSGAHDKLTTRQQGSMRTFVPKGRIPTGADRFTGF